MKNWKTSRLCCELIRFLTFFAILGTIQHGILLFLCFDQEIFTSEDYFSTRKIQIEQFGMVLRAANDLSATLTNLEANIQETQETLETLTTNMELSMENGEDVEHTWAESMKLHEELEATQRQGIETTLENFSLLWAPETTNLQVKVVAIPSDVVLLDTFRQKEYSPLQSYATDHHTFYFALQKDLPVTDVFSNSATAYQLLKNQSDQLPLYLLANSLLAVLLLLMVAKQAGHQKGVEGISQTYWEKIPTELSALVLVGIFCGSLYLFYVELSDQPLNYLGMILSPSQSASIPLLFTLFPLLGLSSFSLLKTVETFSIRVKSKTLFKNTLLWKCGSLLMNITSLGTSSLKKIPIIWRTLCIALLLCTINGLLGIFSVTSFFPFLCFALYNFALLLFFCGLSWQMKLLQKGAESLVSGNFQEKINTKKMYLDCKIYGETLNQIGDSIGLAVEEKTRSQRMKTELITNVSHDIKTPLTSIVTCVELLQQDHNPQEHEEYLALLQRQSMRMKKLVEDLVEASKATTGNLSVELIDTDLVEATTQALAEYEERFSSRHLHLILHLPEECKVLGDGKHLWRVLDNVLSNVNKYAQEGTRVYVAVTKQEDLSEISIKNISAQPLNMSAEELMERFVRGDASRSTEGSGLGLNIAQNLMQLQNGHLKLTIDGDLVKVQLLLRNV